MHFSRGLANFSAESGQLENLLLLRYHCDAALQCMHKSPRSKRSGTQTRALQTAIRPRKTRAPRMFFLAPLDAVNGDSLILL